MTAPTVIGQAQPVPPGDVNPGRPGARVLTDGTVLIATLDYNTGTVTLRHYTRDLGTVLATATVGGGGDDGLTLAPAPDDATVMLLAGPSTTTILTITTDPLAITQTGTTPTRRWWETHAAAILHGGRTIIGAGRWPSTTGYAVIVIEDGQVAASHPVPGVIVGLAPGPTDGTVYASVWGLQPAAPTVYQLDLGTGAVTTVATPAQPHDVDYITGGIPTPQGWVFPAVEDDGALNLRLRDEAGTLLADTEWPGEATYQDGYPGTAWHPHGTILTAGVNPFVGDMTGTTSIVAAQVTGPDLALTHVAAPVVPYGSILTWSQSPVIAAEGTTAIILWTLGQGFDAANYFGVLAWTLDLGARDYHGVLHIDTLTHPAWLVGTADPDMAYRLHVDTGTERLVEILAGQDEQATHRLRVCDGTDWPVAAYLRPE